MRSFFLVFSILLLSIVATGCDKSGIHPLGRSRNVVVAADSPTTTWLRSTDAGTEILLIGINSETSAPTDATSKALIFARGFIAHDSSTTLDTGTYTLDAQGSGTFTYNYHYYFPYEPAKAILDRTGSKRDDLSPPTVETLAIEADTKTLLVTFNGTQHRYTSFPDLVDAALAIADTPAGATAFFRIYNLPLFISQNRLLGFGSAGMTQYVAPSDGEFAGLVAGDFVVSVESYLTPNTTITYTHFQDLTGIEINGAQYTSVDLHGDGTMSNALTWAIADSTGATIVSGTCDYSPMIIKNGIAAGGHYDFTVDGHGGVTQQDYTLAANVDLRDVLPVATP